MTTTAVTVTTPGASATSVTASEAFTVDFSGQGTTRVEGAGITDTGNLGGGRFTRDTQKLSFGLSFTNGQVITGELADFLRAVGAPVV